MEKTKKTNKKNKAHTISYGGETGCFDLTYSLRLLVTDFDAYL